MHYFTKIGYGDSYILDEEKFRKLEEKKRKNSTNSFSEIYLPRLNETKSMILKYWFFFKMCFTSDPKFKIYLTSSANKRIFSKAVNSVSQIDRISRIIFPLFFLILNVLYWFNYYNFS